MLLRLISERHAFVNAARFTLRQSRRRAQPSTTWRDTPASSAISPGEPLPRASSANAIRFASGSRQRLIICIRQITFSRSSSNAYLFPVTGSPIKTPFSASCVADKTKIAHSIARRAHRLSLRRPSAVSASSAARTTNERKRERRASRTRSPQRSATRPAETPANPRQTQGRARCNDLGRSRIRSRRAVSQLPRPINAAFAPIPSRARVPQT